MFFKKNVNISTFKGDFNFSLLIILVIQKKFSCKSNK